MPDPSVLEGNRDRPLRGVSQAARLAGRVRKVVTALIARISSETRARTYGPRLLARSIEHRHGPREIEYGPREVVVICVVRNGAAYLDAFVDHHRGLGVRHIVFLDNDSTDGTPELAARHDDVTVLSTKLPYRLYENLMKTYLARRFSRDRWNLCCDIDELFDYPGSDRIGLASFLDYLNARGFSAVVAQMLDLVADRPLSQLRDEPGAGHLRPYQYYDLSAIEKVAYSYSSLSSDAVKMHFGGLRKQVFGTRNGLSKAALVLVRDKIRLFHQWHHTRNALVADVTCVLKHYPFTAAFYEKVEEAARSGRYGYLTSDEYRAYWSVLERDADLNLRGPSARRYADPSQLLDEAFLVASPAYREWVEAHSK